MVTKRRKKETFSRWDAADYLKSEEDMVAYLKACFEEAPDDPKLLAAALGDIARAVWCNSPGKPDSRAMGSTRHSRRTAIPPSRR